MDIVLTTVLHFEENLDKVLDNLDTEFRLNLQKYRQFSRCSTEIIIEEVCNYISMKRYISNTPDMFANINQTKVIVSHAGTDIRYTVGDSYSQTVHLCKNEDHYNLLIVNKEQETTNFSGCRGFSDDFQAVEDDISYEDDIISLSIRYLSLSAQIFPTADFLFSQIFSNMG